MNLGPMVRIASALSCRFNLSGKVGRHVNSDPSAAAAPVKMIADLELARFVGAEHSAYLNERRIVLRLRGCAAAQRDEDYACESCGYPGHDNSSFHGHKKIIRLAASGFDRAESFLQAYKSLFIDALLPKIRIVGSQCLTCGRINGTLSTLNH